jgi:hypothetical protein
MPWEPAVAAFGVTAAFLIVGGAVLLRYQRDRQHFLLAKAAIERGGSPALPGQLPPWLISLRVGVVVLALGLGLIAAGAIVYNTVGTAAYMPAESATTVAAVPPPPGYPAPPPAPPAQMERWHRGQNQLATGLGALCAGAILTLLGLVRIVFAGFERKYSVAADRVSAP